MDNSRNNIDHVSYDLAQLRRRDDDARIDRDRRPDQSQRAPSRIGTVYNGGSIPTSVPAIFLTHPTALDVVEAEGNAFSVLSDSTSVPMLCTGPGVPTAGSFLLADLIDGLWVATFGLGSGGSNIDPGASCPCHSVPTVLSLDVSGCSSTAFFSDTLRYGPTPSGLSSLNLGTNCFLGDTLFTDGDTGDLFRYYFSCQSNYFALTRVYESSLYGSPYRDILLFNWPLPWLTNTCSPFYLHAGVIYPGGDPTCVLQVHG